MMPMQPSCLFVIRHLPARLTVAAEILDQILMAAAFDMPVSILFMDAGVVTLTRGQIDGEPPALASMYGALALHDHVTMVVEDESMHALHLVAEDLCLPVSVMPRSELAAWMRQHDILQGV